jgi:DNA-binding beta-propeller fold protein YncE
MSAEVFQFVDKWGTFGSGDGEFDHPIDIAVDGAGYVYVTEIDNNRVQKFMSDGTFVKRWGTNGARDEEFFYPRGSRSMVPAGSTWPTSITAR